MGQKTSNDSQFGTEVSLEEVNLEFSMVTFMLMLRYPYRGKMLMERPTFSSDS